MKALQSTRARRARRVRGWHEIVAPSGNGSVHFAVATKTMAMLAARPKGKRAGMGVEGIQNILGAGIRSTLRVRTIGTLIAIGHKQINAQIENQLGRRATTKGHGVKRRAEDA